MWKRLLVAACVAGGSAGCSAASAEGVDPNNDIHCAALASGFRIAADIEGAPQNQKKAIAFVDEWYSPKFDDAVKERGRDSVSAEAQAVIKAFDEDMPSLRDDFLLCSERAIEDAGLN